MGIHGFFGKRLAEIPHEISSASRDAMREVLGTLWADAARKMAEARLALIAAQLDTKELEERGYSVSSLSVPHAPH